MPHSGHAACVEHTCAPSTMENPARGELTLPGLSRSLEWETQLLTRLVYKNKNQHRRAGYFRELLQVKNCLHDLLKHMPQLGDCNGGTGASVTALRERPELDLEMKRSWLGDSWVWMQHIQQKVFPAILVTSRSLFGLLSQGFFLPLAVTLLSLIGRCRSLLQEMCEAMAYQCNECRNQLKIENSVHTQSAPQDGFPGFVSVSFRADGGVELKHSPTRPDRSPSKEDGLQGALETPLDTGSTVATHFGSFQGLQIMQQAVRPRQETSDSNENKDRTASASGLEKAEKACMVNNASAGQQEGVTVAQVPETDDSTVAGKTGREKQRDSNAVKKAMVDLGFEDFLS